MKTFEVPIYVLCKSDGYHERVVDATLSKEKADAHEKAGGFYEVFGEKLRVISVDAESKES